MATASRILEGYAAVFDQPTPISVMDDGKRHTFIEAIRPGAFSFALQDTQTSTVFLRDHDMSLILGRRGRNLVAKENETGLHFRLDVPLTSLGDETIALVDRQVLEGCSFAFTVARDSWHEPEKGKPPLRLIEMIGALFDLSICSSPAYPTTSVKKGTGVVRMPTAEELALRSKLAELQASAAAYANKKPPKEKRSLPTGRRIDRPGWFRDKGVFRRGCRHAIEWGEDR